MFIVLNATVTEGWLRADASATNGYLLLQEELLTLTEGDRAKVLDFLNGLQRILRERYSDRSLLGAQNILLTPTEIPELVRNIVSILRMYPNRASISQELDWDIRTRELHVRAVLLLSTGVGNVTVTFDDNRRENTAIYSWTSYRAEPPPKLDVVKPMPKDILNTPPARRPLRFRGN